jgi:hypothetical protein
MSAQAINNLIVVVSSLLPRASLDDDNKVMHL